VPAEEVTCIRFRALKQPHARPHLLLVSGGGCKALEHVGVLVGDVEDARAAFQDLRQLGACIRPSTVQSATNVEAARAPTTGPRPWRAVEAPVERIGTGADWRGVGTTT